jgi:hypothetical protein
LSAFQRRMPIECIPEPYASCESTRRLIIEATIRL